jgi:pimeloyl-ACP methyl ester carboxylesterase
MTISHEIFGQGSHNVIVLHDWSQDRTLYQPIHRFLARNDFTFAFADARGYGESKDQTGAFSAAEVVSDVAALADSLGWSKFSLVGHSMTGMVAQRAMVDIPDRLLSVVATTPVPASGLALDDDTFNFFVSMASDDEAFKQGMHALTSARYADDWTGFKLRRNRATVATEAMVAYAHMWAKSDFSNEVQGLTTPILVVFGAHDNELLTQATLAPVFEGWYPNLQTHVCPSGHYPMQETPVEYAHVVQKYLAATAAA